jgi:hypothetical protein
MLAFAFEPSRVSIVHLQKVTQTLAPSVGNGGGCRQNVSSTCANVSSLLSIPRAAR